MASDFDWSETDDNDLVAPSISATVAYLNSKGDIVIRQQGILGQEDAVIVLPTTYAGHLVARINQLLAEGTRND